MILLSSGQAGASLAKLRSASEPAISPTAFAFPFSLIDAGEARGGGSSFYKFTRRSWETMTARASLKRGLRVYTRHEIFIAWKFTHDPPAGN